MPQTPQKTNELVSHIHHANETEVDLGQLAKQKTQNPAVQEYAQQMMAAHQEADQKLLKIVASQNLKVETKAAEKSAEKREKLVKATGTDFDKAYIDCMVEEHEKLLSKLKSAQSWLPEGEVRGFTRELLPTVDHHIMMAKQLQTDLKAVKK